MAKKITKKPSLAVSGLGAPSRGSGNRVMTTSWGIPANLTSTKKKDRATGLDVIWSIGTSLGSPSATVSLGIGSKSASLNLDSMRLGSYFNRNSFYPITNRRLYSVSVRVWTKNTKGRGQSVAQTRNFYAPRTPSVSELSFNTENGVISTTIETDAGTDYYERLDTKYAITVTSPFLNDGNPTNTSDSASTSTSFSINYDARDYMRLDYNQYIKVVASAYARGYAGNSGTATRTEYISYPAQATIEGVDVSGRDSTGKCTVRINTNSTTEHPVDTVRLQYAADVTYDDPSDIPANEWTSTDIIDNANCTAMSIATGNLIPSRGNYTYVRVVTYHLHENVLYRYSQPWRVEELETPSTPPASINIDILEAHTGGDGKSAVVLLGWNKDGRDDFTGTELTWSDSEDTWKSTQEPSMHQFTWSDGEMEYGGETYNDSAEITIKGLSEGEKYFIKARRYLEAENEQFSNYSNTATVLTSEIPESIVASCNRYIADGDPLSVYWTFAGNGLQTAWQIVRVVDGETDGTIIAEGEGSTGSTQISADRIAEMTINNSLSFVVRASTGSGFVESEMHIVGIIEQPTLSIVAPSTMTAQPFSFVATSNRLCDLIVIVASQGATGQFPQGIMMQTAGDTIHSNVYIPEWVDGSATITLPSGLNFWDLGKYTLSVVAVDRETSLRSSEVTASFSVAWANQAVSPVQTFYELTSDTEVIEDEAYYALVEGEYVLVTPEGTENPSEEGWYTQDSTSFVTLTVVDRVDSDGDHTQGVQIELTPPTGSSETDVYDIYRMDVENPSLIGQGFPLTHTVLDEYAPFGTDVDLRYRIALRTIDGDVEFADIEYEAECEYMRFDWATGFLELPYGLAYGETFKKDVDIRHHMDGSTDGYWNRNVDRTASMNSEVIKIIQPRDIERARLLARYNGAVFVRLPNGAAFVADVQVTDLSKKNEAVVHMAFDATEVGITEEFILPIPFVLNEGEGGE